MPKITDTYALAYACCNDVLTETGKFPTIEAIKARIGVNSPNTISHAIKAWTQDFAEKQLDKQSRPGLPTVLLDSIEQIWKLAATEAQKNYAEKEAVFKATIASLQSTIAQQQSALTQFDQQVELLQLEQQRLLQTVAALEVLQTEGLRNNNILQDQVATLDNQLAHKEKQRLEQEEQWKIRQEQDQQWFARRLDEEKTFIEQTWRDKYQRQQETIQSLALSEDSLRQTCLALNLEHKKVLHDLKALQEQQKTLEKKRKGVVRNNRFAKHSA